MVEQGSAEWKQLRVGKITASRIADIIAKTKSGYSTSRENYMYELAIERLTNTYADSFTSSAMQWGVDQEVFARSCYEIKNNIFVSQIDFVLHPDMDFAGCSPDGLVDNGIAIIEIKCPLSKTHIKYLMDGTPPKEYVPQMAWQLACTGREYCDFVSYDPRLPDDLQLFVVKYERDKVFIDMLIKEVIKFNQEVEETVLSLRRIKNGS